MAESKQRMNMKWVHVGVVALVLLGIVFKIKNSDYGKSVTSGDKWQAVFLTNGQVYFGHIAKKHGGYISLENVYYLQAQSQIQPAPADQQNDPQLSLSKLGRFELHCPVDKMNINSEQVLFYEDLKEDSKVAMAIKRYIETGDQNKNCYEPQSETQANG